MMGEQIRMMEEAPSVAVAKAIAELEGTDPTALPPLFESVDPDALDDVCRSLNNGHVTFAYCGYSVTIDHTMELHVEER